MTIKPFDDRFLPHTLPAGSDRGRKIPQAIDLADRLQALPFGYRVEDVTLPLRDARGSLQNVFVLPGENRDLVYAPLRRKIVAVPRDGAPALEWCPEVKEAVNAMAASPEVDLWALETQLNPPGTEPTEAVFIPAENCNLKCAYCYSSADLRGARLDVGVSLRALEACARAVQRQRLPVLSLRFLGGGEPTVNWEVVTETVAHLRKLAKDIGVRSNAALVTNGVMSADHAEWCATHFDEIMVSLDGPPEIQNKNRPTASGAPSFDLVAKTMRILQRGSATVVVRATVVEDDLPRMTEIVQFLHEEFRLSQVCLEPVSICGRAEEGHLAPPPPAAFCDAFLAARAAGWRLGVQVEYSSAVLGRLQVKFCTTMGRQFGLAPDGSITACSEVHKTVDERADVIMIGRIPASGDAIIELPKVDALRERTVDKIPSCSACFARFHCSGGCPMRSWRDGKGFFGAYESMCATVRALIRDELEHVVDQRLAAGEG